MGGRYSKDDMNRAAAEAVAEALEKLQDKPSVTNETIQAIEARFNMQLEEQRRQREEAEAKAEERAREAREFEAAARMREEAARHAAEQLEAAARKREEAAASIAKQADANIREARELEAAAKMREDAAAAAAKAAKAAAEEAIRQEAAAKEREKLAIAEAVSVSKALVKGIRPIVDPTKEEFDAAMKKLEYDPEKLHFAVCGTSGSGKSSLVNAFRNVVSKQKDAAAVGVTETTSEITRYPDSRSDLPYSRFVWYDIPGAGTTAVSDWQYFNDQGLFVFDFIVVVYDVRFTKIDVGIIENCFRFNIPVFIVRSKADQHIDNMIKAQYEAAMESGSGEDISDRQFHEQVYEETKAKYVKTTRSDFDKHMKDMSEGKDVDERDRQMILAKRVYMVSASNVRSQVLHLQSGGVKGIRADQEKRLIDEALLIEDMLRAATMRRCLKPEEKALTLLKPENKGFLRKGREAICAKLAFRLAAEAPKP